MIFMKQKDTNRLISVGFMFRSEWDVTYCSESMYSHFTSSQLGDKTTAGIVDLLVVDSVQSSQRRISLREYDTRSLTLPSGAAHAARAALSPRTVAPDAPANAHTTKCSTRRKKRIAFEFWHLNQRIPSVLCLWTEWVWRKCVQSMRKRWQFHFLRGTRTVSCITLMTGLSSDIRLWKLGGKSTKKKLGVTFSRQTAETCHWFVNRRLSNGIQCNRIRKCK